MGVACRWRVPPGAGPAGIIVDVFRGKVPPLAADAQPLLTHEAWYVMQVRTRMLYAVFLAVLGDVGAEQCTHLQCA